MVTDLSGWAQVRPDLGTPDQSKLLVEGTFPDRAALGRMPIGRSSSPTARTTSLPVRAYFARSDGPSVVRECSQATT